MPPPGRRRRRHSGPADDEQSEHGRGDEDDGAGAHDDQDQQQRGAASGELGGIVSMYDGGSALSGVAAAVGRCIHINSPRHLHDAADVVELRRADRLEFSEGADWSEAGIGTNAISEALVTGRPVQLFSAEHLVRTHHEWACTAAPITDPLTGKLLGVLDVSGPLDSLSVDTLRMVRCADRVAESLLGTPDGGTSVSAASSVRSSRQSVRRPSVGVESLELLGDRPAAVFVDGSRVPLTLRRAEILALLDSHAQGWSAEELAYELYGDAGTPQAIPTEMFRVRSLLGEAVESPPTGSCQPDWVVGFGAGAAAASRGQCR